MTIDLSKPESIEKQISEWNAKAATETMQCIALLDGRYEAQEISESLLIAYYLRCSGKNGWDYHHKYAHEKFRTLAQKLGYRVERLEP